MLVGGAAGLAGAVVTVLVDGAVVLAEAVVTVLAGGAAGIGGKVTCTGVGVGDGRLPV